ncbi:MAG TPA: hypothetical protein VE571_07730 [Solirubrobacteraceae bacterium]|nr:hypothetical protein [Solirubrobacteraceae bacterium]
MSEVSTRDFVTALVLKALLDRTAGEERANGRVATATPAPARTVEAPARPARAVPALVLLAVGAVTMVVFESPVTRLIGVLALLGFVVAGAFAIADPRWLGTAPVLGADEARERT